MEARAHVLIEGMVQGVFFRAYTKETAKSLNLSGWVKNCWDGRVEAVFEGDKKNIEEIIKWCYKGPSSASVIKVEVSWEKYTGDESGFTIAY